MENKNQLKISLLNIILNYIQDRDWINYDNFADNFVDEILEEFEKGNFNFNGILNKTSSASFLKLNSLTKTKFLTVELMTKIIQAWNRGVKYQVPVVYVTDIFPELKSISDFDVQVDKLDIPEIKIQTVLREVLRERGASPLFRRKKDTVLEISDLEYFNMKVNGRDCSVSVVVKGYRSITGYKDPDRKINLEDIAHQVIKAYFNHPDYVLVVCARDVVDSVPSWLQKYGEDIGNKNLIVLIPPLDLAKFLRWRRIV